MVRVLVTGLSGTGESTALLEPGRGGFTVIDTDSPASSDWMPLPAPGTNGSGARTGSPSSCTHETDASRPLEDVVEALIAIGTGVGADRPTR